MSTLDQNIEKLNGYVARLKTSGIMNRINGEDRVGGAGAVSYTHLTLPTKA